MKLILKTKAFLEHHLIRIFFISTIIVGLTQCSKTDPVSGEKVLIETDAKKKLNNQEIVRVEYLELLVKVNHLILSNFQLQTFCGEQLLNP